MSQLVILAGAYDGLNAADADYEGIKKLHSNGEIGSYDSAIVSKDQLGNVTVTKAETPTHHGAWAGLAAGAAVGLLFPPALPGVVAVGGAAIGAWIGHLAHGISRRDAIALGETLYDGKAALIVVATDKHSNEIEGALTHSTRHVVKHVENSSHEDAEREAIAALEDAEKAPVTA